MSLRSAVVAVGDELLLGDIVNGNAAWLGAALATAGTPVVHSSVVGDDVERIVTALRRAAEDADIVLVTGGLGPTSDDRTRDALAHWAGSPLEATPLDNPVGTAPGLRLEVGGRLVYALPGRPQELAAVMTGSVLPELAERVGAATGSATGSGRGDGTLAGVVLTRLRERGATVAVAESLTAGLLGAALTTPPGSSDVFRGGVLAYATDLKQSLAGVPGPLLSAHGAVSPETAGAMAAGVRARLGATYGVALTGVAGPDEQEGHPPGTVHVAVAGPQGGTVESHRLPGDRDRVRAAATTAALDLLRRALG
jgi:nicotinamide-nucleotide amidase